MTDTPVTTVMSRPVVSVRLTDTLDDALRMFSCARLRHLAVTDRTGRCVGLLSDREVTRAWAQNPAALSQATVGSLLDADQPLLRTDATVAAAARAMRRCGTDVAVVVDDDSVARGILTAGDVVGLLARPASPVATIVGPLSDGKRQAATSH